jgi:hypothetical protein
MDKFQILKYDSQLVFFIKAFTILTNEPEKLELEGIESSS